MAKPNLFDFATSELSQDAFLCWLAALADHDDAELAELGRAFIAWLWNTARREAVSGSDVRLLQAPRRQKNHIDILFDAEVNGRSVLFLIEDKTNTSHHSGQLARYRADVGECEVVPIYFKTGYHFGADATAAAFGYTVIGLTEWVTFLRAHQVDSDILADYLVFSERQLQHRETCLAHLLTADGYKQLGHDFVQYEFVKRLADACPQTVGDASIDRGNNRNGSSWAHFCFATFDAALPGGESEVLFHRIDERSRRYYLCTRQYARVKDVADARAEKLRRRDAYVTWFAEAVADSSSGLDFASPSRRGANESEIGILFFDAKANTPARVLERLPLVHAAFVERLRASIALGN